MFTITLSGAMCHNAKLLQVILPQMTSEFMKMVCDKANSQVSTTLLGYTRGRDFFLSTTLLQAAGIQNILF